MHRERWHSLFDGRTTAGWHGYGKQPLSSAWHVEEGLLTTRGTAGGDIVTDLEFEDFELEVEWKISPGGNSGIFYRVDETAALIWQRAPEMQLLDDDRHPDGRDLRHRAGALYDLCAPMAAATCAVGEFNLSRIVAHGSRVEHWLNGSRVARYDSSSPEWKARVADSKFAGEPCFGEPRKGPFALQDHGDLVWFKNIRVR